MAEQQNNDRSFPVGYIPETVLTIEQVAAWLQIGVRSAERLPIPCFYLGTRTRRYLARDVLAYIDGLEHAA